MPHLRFRGCKHDEVSSINAQLIEDLTNLIKCESEDFTFEYIDSTFIFEGKEDGNRYPFVEVLWFKRDEIKSEVAKVITEHLSKFGYDYITVYFNNLNPGDYYENAKSF